MLLLYFCLVASYAKGSHEMTLFFQEAVAVLGMACYISGSMPSMLLIAHNFADDFQEGVLTNANCGGEYVMTRVKGSYSSPSFSSAF